MVVMRHCELGLCGEAEVGEEVKIEKLWSEGMGIRMSGKRD
jgi:hypothetical protein